MKLLTNIEQIKHKDTVIVANNRQILAFKKQYSAAQMPKVLSWHNLLLHLWELSDNYMQKQFIDNNEMHHIFQNIINNNVINSPQIIATEVLNNYAWYKKQMIVDNEIMPQNSIQKYFLQWIKKYQSIKKNYHLIDIFDLPETLNIHKNYNYYSYGFKALTRQQIELFKKLAVKKLIIDDKNQQFDCKIFTTIEEEINNCINWASKLRVEDENKSIAIIVPELEKNYHYFEYGFNKIFEQNLTQTKNKFFNISLGKPLANFNLIKDLLLILGVSKQIEENKINSKDLIKIFVSKFIDMHNNHKFIKNILKLEKEFISKRQLLDIVKNNQTFVTIISQLNYIKNQYYYQWLDSFTSILNIWGFNKLRKMTSDEYQIFNKYQSSSLIFNKFSIFNKKINFKLAIVEFESVFKKIVFQPQSGKNQIQIMGMLEAEGLKFDYAWIVGINNKTLPFSLKLLRYIPNEICKKYKIPRSEYNHIMTDSKSSINYLSLSAGKPIISFAQMIDDVQFYGSSLIKWPENIEKLAKTINNNQQNLKIINDNNVVNVSNLNINHGVKTIKTQMQCQFKGFANRLNIDDFRVEEIGFNNIQKGNILHQSLEFIYQIINTKNNLLQLNDNEIENIIKSSIKRAMLAYKKDVFYQLTFAQFFDKISQFITLEKERDNWMVDKIETQQMVEIDDLKFKIRVDRIDRNDNKELIIFDYKSGKASINNWCNTIKDPQLPIYAINNKDSSALCFVSFKEGVKYLAMAENKEILNIKSNCCHNITWQEQLQFWQDSITKAANQFKVGKASINPVKGACKYCELDNFCRIITKV